MNTYLELLEIFINENSNKKLWADKYTKKQRLTLNILLGLIILTFAPFVIVFLLDYFDNLYIKLVSAVLVFISGMLGWRFSGLLKIYKLEVYKENYKHEFNSETIPNIAIMLSRNFIKFKKNRGITTPDRVGYTELQNFVNRLEKYSRKPALIPFAVILGIVASAFIPELKIGYFLNILYLGAGLMPTIVLVLILIAAFYILCVFINMFHTEITLAKINRYHRLLDMFSYIMTCEDDKNTHE